MISKLFRIVTYCRMSSHSRRLSYEKAYKRARRNAESDDEYHSSDDSLSHDTLIALERHALAISASNNICKQGKNNVYNVSEGNVECDRTLSDNESYLSSQNSHGPTLMKPLNSHEVDEQNVESGEVLYSSVDDAMPHNSALRSQQSAASNLERSGSIDTLDQNDPLILVRENIEFDGNTAPELVTSYQSFPMSADLSETAELNATNDDNHDECILSRTSTDSESDDSDVDCKLTIGLKQWIDKYDVKLNAVDGLLKLLKENGHSELPACARTLIGSSDPIQVVTKSGMEYYYFGLKTQISNYLKFVPKLKLNSLTHIEISFNVDGLPLFKSSSKSLWPVLCHISNLTPVHVFPVAITCGGNKPTDLTFLSDTVEELQTILNDGISISGQTIPVVLRCVVCDAPAKSFIKCTKLYSGYFGCDRCTQRGVRVERRITYPLVDNLELRTNRSFREQSNAEHHHDVSPFCRLPIDMITTFPIDYMHLCCLGVMRRLLNAWTKGSRETKISVKQINMINQRLHNIKRHIPSCFARKPRSLDEMERWKATEFRQFLLYTGKVVLKGILTADVFSHFLKFSTAISILTNKRLNERYNEEASRLLHEFVRQSSSFYGSTFLVYNVHALLHISEDAKNLGCLDNFSAFPFENYLQYLKRKVRSGRKPLHQIVKRLQERTPLCWPNMDEDISVNVCPPNNSYILSNGSPCDVIEQATDKDGNAVFKCLVFTRAEELFSDPIDSKKLGVYKVKSRNNRLCIIERERLNYPALKMPLGEEDGFFIFMKILHKA